MKNKSSGVLLHPLSFPGKFGCGDLGDSSRKVIDWLKKSGQFYLQILSIGPTGYGNSPYQSYSAFAGNPYFISLDKLYQQGFLKKNDLSDYPDFNPVKINYLLLKAHFKYFTVAFERFKKAKTDEKYIIFCNDNASWLDDYSKYMALNSYFKEKSWNHWNITYENCDEFIKKHPEIDNNKGFHKFLQYQFSSQWNEFKSYANGNNIKIIGDLPIFVSYDSADVWANEKLFLLDNKKKPKVVAGVPPDYFSETGQLWGNPIYNWDYMIKNNFKWWKDRIRHLLKYTDCIKIDHFRGFESYWEIPYGDKTAINGRWIKAPGLKFFTDLKKELKTDLKEIIIAEDLGIITAKVKILRDDLGLPGMKVFEFIDFDLFENDRDAFYKNDYLPENYIGNSVAYPGTHDNDTLKGWFLSLHKKKQEIILDYLGINDIKELNKSVLKKLLLSESSKVIFMIQDFLGKGSNCRINTPGTCNEDNWSWRLSEDDLTEDKALDLFGLIKATGRLA